MIGHWIGAGWKILLTHIRNVIRTCGTSFCCDYNALYCAGSVSGAQAPHRQTEANLVGAPQQGLTLTPVGHMTPDDSPDNYSCHIPLRLWRTAKPTLIAMPPGERDTSTLFRNNKSSNPKKKKKKNPQKCSSSMKDAVSEKRMKREKGLKCLFR